MEGSHYGKAITVLGIGGISTFCKNWMQVWREHFLQFGVSEWVGYGIVIKAHWALS